ncbi:MAG: exonuclease domain-containing protein [Curtobacterium sp.]
MPTDAAGTLLWLDAETTDLDCSSTAILEVAAIITNDQLEEVARLETLVRPPADLLQRLQERPVVLEMHTRSGLLHELMTADLTTLPTVAELEHLLLAMLKQHSAPGSEIALAGSGVAAFDRHLIRAQMPGLSDRLTYWSIDAGVEQRHFQKATGERLIPVDDTLTAHRAMADTEYALAAAREAQVAYRTFAAVRQAARSTVTAEERVLVALGLIGAFPTVDSVDGAHRFTDLYALQPDADHVGGLADAGSMLLDEAAAAAGVDRSALLDRMRRRVLDCAMSD